MIPTTEQIAAAWRYLCIEFVSVEVVDGEQWAEAFAFSRPIGNPDDLAYWLPEARELEAQLTPAQWSEILARARFLHGAP